MKPQATIAFATALALTLLSSPLSAQEKRGYIEPADARAIAQSLRTLELRLGAIGRDRPGVTVSTGVTATAKEDDGDSDDTDQTVSCHGDTEEEALWCSEMLANLVELFDDPGQWQCDSTETGADCTHEPH